MRPPYGEAAGGGAGRVAVSRELGILKCQIRSRYSMNENSLSKEFCELIQAPEGQTESPLARTGGAGWARLDACSGSEGGHRRLRIPADENLAAKGFQRLAPLNEIVILVAFLQFALRVSRKTDLIVVHPSR